MASVQVVMDELVIIYLRKIITCIYYDTMYPLLRYCRYTIYHITCIVQEVDVARLRRSVKDGHLFILAGQSQGTWQVSEKGEQWLRQNLYSIPAEDEYVDIDAGTFSYLKDKGNLYIHGILYDHNGKDATI